MNFFFIRFFVLINMTQNGFLILISGHKHIEISKACHVK